MMMKYQKRGVREYSGSDHRPKGQDPTFPIALVCRPVSREEINEVRANRDPIEIVRKLLLENSFASEAELKDIEKKIRADIDADVEKIKQDPEPTPEDLYTHVGIGKHYIRGINHPDLSQLEY